jgi:hypothetical protein
MFRWLTSRVVAYLNKKRKTPSRLKVFANSNGINVEIVSNAGVMTRTTIAWGEIHKIVLFKRDVYSHDVICMLIESQNKGVLELDETAPGWEQLINRLSDYLPSAIPYEQWYTQVAFPAYKPSAITIYSH